MSAAERASQASSAEQANERANERTEERMAQYSTRRFRILSTHCGETPFSPFNPFEIKTVMSFIGDVIRSYFWSCGMRISTRIGCFKLCPDD